MLIWLAIILIIVTIIVVVILATKKKKSPCIPICSSSQGSQGSQSSQGSACGVPDGCGNICSCPSNYICQNQICVNPNCIPTCINSNGKTKICGDNGCGGSCGSCPVNETCSVDGTECMPCRPNCEGKVCGSDGCTGSCGTCPTNETCSVDGTKCIGCTPNCGSRTCGDDGCGGQCGTGSGPGGCASNCFNCNNGFCQPIPACQGITCGTDACGNNCGTCQSGYTCNNGNCIETPNFYNIYGYTNPSYVGTPQYLFASPDNTLEFVSDSSKASTFYVDNNGNIAVSSSIPNPNNPIWINASPSNGFANGYLLMWGSTNKTPFNITASGQLTLKTGEIVYGVNVYAFTSLGIYYNPLPSYPLYIKAIKIS